MCSQRWRGFTTISLKKGMLDCLLWEWRNLANSLTIWKNWTGIIRRGRGSDCQTVSLLHRQPTTSSATLDPIPNSNKAYGQAVYYGRKVLYKNRAGQHAVVMTPIVNSAGRKPNGTELSAFPRLGEALDIVDDLYTHLYRDGFIPLVRANAHAAIPLRRGRRILQSLFDAESPH